MNSKKYWHLESEFGIQAKLQSSIIRNESGHYSDI
jgi:hypothetical protein